MDFLIHDFTITLISSFGIIRQLLKNKFLFWPWTPFWFYIAIWPHLWSCLDRAIHKLDLLFYVYYDKEADEMKTYIYNIIISLISGRSFTSIISYQ